MPIAMHVGHLAMDDAVKEGAQFCHRIRALELFRMPHGIQPCFLSCFFAQTPWHALLARDGDQQFGFVEI